MQNLLQKQLMSTVNIQIFTASERLVTEEYQGEIFPTDESNWPTCTNVISAMQNIISMAKTGDFVYVHYSGHGTRMKPVFEISNHTVGDLALVLLQGQQSPEKYLSGPRLAGLLKGMTDKGLIVTVVLDCCFSASVYRNSELDDNVRFLADESEAEMNPEDITRGDSSHLEYRDGSMRDNWLIDPDRYTILAACGPREIAKGGFEAMEKQRSYGLLSYFLAKTLSDHGLDRMHKDIYRHIRSVFEQHRIPQNPLLYGNGNQGFFGIAKQHSGIRHACVVKPESIRLLSGAAHGVCRGDRFSLRPSKSVCEETTQRERTYAVGEVTQIGPLTSEMRLSGVSETIQTGWVAEPLTSSNMSNFLIQLDPGLLCYDGLLESLKRKGLGIFITGDPESAAQAIQVMCRTKVDYSIVNRPLENILHIPRVPCGEGDIESLCNILEHLARFQMVKTLFNKSPAHAFLQSVQVQISLGDQTFKQDEQIHTQHEGLAQLIVKNMGNTDIFVHVYNMGPCGRVKNIFGGTFVQVPPKGEADRIKGIGCTGIYKKKIKMKVPPVLQADGFCIDIIKVFVTSKATSFEMLELPNFQQLESHQPGHRESNGLSEDVEDWMAFNFYMRTVM
ncbi:putative caspase [Fusarium austroafricanum]|uniref:Putative caspase n=1 Tax=Fusarium austroafricanum TaxID=2364996 RepID=A0A8H4KJD0_9HYPO|nr:putative caspase [Fusarium austroafricanum]